MDLCHFEHLKQTEQLQKYNGSVVIRGDNVKDDSGRCAVLTEHGVSASYITAAKVLNTMSR